MLIDRSHQGWIAVTVLLFVLSSGLYVYYALTYPGGPSGGTWPGLLFGVVGSALMLFAGLLSARKQFPAARLGRAAAWLKGHIWLGLLSVPLIAFHAAFRLGGLVEQVLWLALAVVIGSGIVGLVIQRIIPRTMTARVPLESIYEQIGQVCSVMREEADDLVESVCGELPATLRPADEAPAKRKRKAKPVAGAGPLLDFYLRQVRPFLGPDYLGRHRLADPSQAEGYFIQMRKRLPPELEDPLDQLSAYCEERRQLATQVRLHGWMHGWLFLHVPLSVALLVFGVAHVVSALYY